MTREEASIIIGNIPIPLVILGTHDKCYSLTEYQTAKAMAIQSLAAWEEVKKDLYKFASDSFDAECAECYRIALRCIEGHLKEVEA